MTVRIFRINLPGGEVGAEDGGSTWSTTGGYELKAGCVYPGIVAAPGVL